MAYASLLLLTQTLEQIVHDPDDQCQVLHQQEEQIGRSLLEKIVSDSEDIIESQIDISDQDVSDSRNHCERCVDFRRHNLAKKYENLQKVIQELDSISEQVVNMKDRNDVENLPPRSPFPAGSSKFGSSNNNDMVGFDDDLMQIKDRLTGPPSKLKILSIVGMGGIGKTTFARNVYDDPLIKYHFDTRAWTTISQEYNVQKMLTDLLDSTKYHSNIGNLAEKLYKCLKGKRYLIVLDDMWDAKAWDETVFGEECCPCELEEIGKEIAKNCKGLPLALVVIGGLLYKGKRTHDNWMYVKQNVNSAVIDTDDQFMEILLLSYNHLPHHLRACFLYMAVFPEDYKIRKSKLTKLWVAERFIKPDRSKSLEAVAETYVEDLLDRNMILVHKRSYTGKIKICSIHDLMRDLCVRKAQEENFLHLFDRHVKNFPEGTYNQRRVNILSDIYGRHLEDIYGSHVRSLLYCFSDIFVEVTSFTPRFLLLRVLDAVGILFYEFPDDILELVNLRFIVLKCKRTCELPAYISKLCNLQTLIIHSRGVVYLPSAIWKMPRLRHISARRCFLDYPSDAGYGGKVSLLENLQTLKGVVEFNFTKKVLQMMPNLKKLSCSFLDSYFRIDKFIHLQQLEDLNCFFTENYLYPYLRTHTEKRQYPLLEKFHLPPALKKLTLNGCRLSWKSMAIIGSLPNLEVLNLKEFTFDGSSAVNSVKVIQEEQRDLGNDNLHIIII
ncbi:Disease resistance RPP8-like protein 3 [Forsythia ovata]|uniref:Disease resistance RPP8-like protein 3 n=1 Tax=Forsythia ovata TaxID=205694 RepID=A0ABD1TS08_9LAMI